MSTATADRIAQLRAEGEAAVAAAASTSDLEEIRVRLARTVFTNPYD